MSYNKIIRELSQYHNFKETFKFQCPDIIEIDGVQSCSGFPIFDTDGKYIPECEKWINAGYQIKGSFSKLLSNLYPYEFNFRGFKLKSIESFFQGIKFNDPAIQQTVFTYSGTDAYHIQAASSYNWRETGYIYWQGLAIKRDSEDYDMLVDEVYISASQNPLYRQVLKNINKPIIHSIGKISKTETVFTRYEYERELNSLAAFLKSVDNNTSSEKS